MTIKDSNAGVDPNVPVVTATLVPDDDPEIDVSAPAASAPPIGNPPAYVPAAAAAASMPPAYVPGTTEKPGKVKPSVVASNQTTTVPTTTTTTTTTTVATATISPLDLGRDPTGLRCPYCQQEMVTKTRDQIDACTVVAVVLLLIFFWPLFWIPFCCPACKSTEHYCGRCNRKVGETGSCS